MPIYRVFLRCDGLDMLAEGKPVRWGFFKNEYVRAGSPESAVDRAMKDVRSRLSQNPNVKEVDVASLPLAVEGVEAGAAFWRLLLPQGFIFFPLDADEDDEETEDSPVLKPE